MSKTRNLSDLLDANGDVKSTALDNVPPSNDASALTTGTLDSARLPTEIVSSDTTPQLGGDLDTNGHNINLGDADTINIGSSNDLQIKHTGSNSLIADTGTGNLIVRANDLRVQSYALENTYINASEGGSVDLYHNNSKKFETTSAGATVTGTLTATAFSGDGSALTNVPAGVSNVNMVVFTSSGTYTPTSGTKFVTVYATGGGGGGGGADWNVNNQYTRNAGAGGGGGTAIRTYNATELGSSASVTIGGGGGGGGISSDGGSGGNTSFNPSGTGTTATGNGGSGGTRCYNNSNSNAVGQQGIGGNASGGEVNINGQMGQSGGGTNGGLVVFQNNSDKRVQANYGGGTFFGGNRNRQVNGSATNGGTGQGIGVGGNGAHGHQQNYGTATGGAGTSGIVLIVEYA